MHLSLDLLQLIGGFCTPMKECYNFFLSASLSYIVDQISLDYFQDDKVQGVCKAFDMFLQPAILTAATILAALSVTMTK